MTPRAELSAVVTGLLLMGIFFFAPVVPYSQGISIPGNYRYARTACSSVIGSGSGGTFSFSTTTYTCLEANGTLPAAVVSGHGSPSFLLLGSGVDPFPGSMVVRQGNMTALVYFSGGRAVKAESLGFFPGTLINPPGLVSISNVDFTIAGFGNMNFSATVHNVGETTLSDPVVYLESPQVDSVYSLSNNPGITWVAPFPIGQCHIQLQGGFPPGRSCTVSHLLSLGEGGETTLNIEVRGGVNGTYFVYRQAFNVVVPSAGIGKAWVGEFIQGVNNARGPSPLVESSSLDAFAAERFNTASAEPDISDFNYTADANAWFGTGRAQGTSEVLLFPGGYNPSDFISYLRGSAPGHWSALTNLGFRQFGYYVGQAPYVQVSANCPVSEVLGEGVNITQYFQSRGCAVTPTGGVVWLVIVLAP